MTEDDKSFKHVVTTVGFVAFTFTLGMFATCTKVLQPSVLTSCQTACGAQGVDHVTPAECVCRDGAPTVEAP